MIELQNKMKISGMVILSQKRPLPLHIQIIK